MHDDTSTTEVNMAKMNDADNSPEEAYFRKSVHCVLFDNVVTGLTACLNAVKNMAENFDLLWKYEIMCESELEKKAKRLFHYIRSDLSDEDLAEEMRHLPAVHKVSYGKPELKPLELLNLLTELCELLPYVCINMRILLKMPATVPSTERSLSKLKLRTLFAVYYVSNSTC